MKASPSARFVEPFTAEQKTIYIDRQFESRQEKKTTTAAKRSCCSRCNRRRFLHREPATSKNKAGDAFPTSPRGFVRAVGYAARPRPSDSRRDGAARRAPRRAPCDEAHDERPAGPAKRFDNFCRSGCGSTNRANCRKTRRSSQASIRSSSAICGPRSRCSSMEIAVVRRVRLPQAVLAADQLYMNGRLAKLYGVDLPEDALFTEGDAAAGDHGGGSSTHPSTRWRSSPIRRRSSPIHRGVFLARNILGVSTRPPPDALHAAAAGVGAEPEHPRADHAADEAEELPGLSRHHQPARLHTRKLRRHRPLPNRGERQTGRLPRIVRDAFRRHGRVSRLQGAVEIRADERRIAGSLRRPAVPQHREAADSGVWSGELVELRR